MSEIHACSVWCEICVHACTVCDVIIRPGSTLCDAHACNWCEALATVDIDGDDPRCSACDRRWFPDDLTDRIIATLREEIGLHAEVVGMGGGCEAVRISYQRADGRFLHVSDGDAARPTTRAIFAQWLDDDNGDGDDFPVVALAVDVDLVAWDVDEAIATIVSAVA